MKKKHWPKTSGMAAVFSLALLAACAPIGIPISTKPAEARVVTYAYFSTFPNLDPSVSFSNELVVLANLYEPLVWYSTESLKPGLATSWESSDDGLRWTFHLRKGVKFHDGSDFNAEAVKYSIERTKNMGLGASFIWDAVDEVKVIDDYTVEFKLKYAAPLDLIATSSYAAWIISPTAVKAQGEKASDWFNEGHDAGTGPYTIESYERGKKIVLTKFDDYWGGWQGEHFDKAVILMVEDPTVRQEMIESGEADITLLLPLESLEALDARDDIEVVSGPSFRNLLGFFNTRKPPLDNVQVRQALSYAFPYDVFVESVMLGYAIQSRGPIPSGMFGYNENLRRYQYNFDKARELLAAAGYPDGGFELQMTVTKGDVSEVRAGELYRAELARLGINLKVTEMSWEDQWSLAMGEPEKAQDILVMYWWPTYVTPYDFLFNMFHSEEKILFNLCYYSNPKFDEKIDKANELMGTDREQAEKLFFEAQEILVEDAPALFLVDLDNISTKRANLSGHVYNPGYTDTVFFYQLSRGK